MNLYERSLAGLECTATSLTRVSAELLRAHGTASSIQEERLSNATSRKWFEKTAKFVLNWMSLGDIDALRVVRDGLRKCIGENPAHRDFLAKLNAEELTLLRAAFLEELLTTCDFSFNRVRFSKILGSTRQWRWRRALITLHQSRRPLSAADLVAAGVFQIRGTADHALGELEKLHLLHHECEGHSRHKTYSLTQLGRAAASMAREIEEEEAGAGMGDSLRSYDRQKHQPADIAVTLSAEDRQSFLGKNG